MIWIPALRAMLRDGAETRGLIEEELTHSVIGAFFDVHNTLGYGFLEHGPEPRFHRLISPRALQK